MRLPEELQFFQNSRRAQLTTPARMDGKVCVITGATSGVGYQAARRLAEGGAYLVLICRNEVKARSLQSELANDYGANSDIIIADFFNLNQVTQAAQAVSASFPQVHVLINNAGIFNKRRRLTVDGFEETFCVIHLAAYLLTRLLEKNLKSGSPSRIIEINSEAHRFGGLQVNDLDWTKRIYIPLRAYGAANIAKLLTAMELAERLRSSGVTVNVMHPGEVRTNIGMNNPILYRLYNHYVLRWFLKDPAIAGDAVYYLAAAPELQNITGKFYNKTIEEKPASYILKKETQRKIWEISEHLIRPYLEEPDDL
jgi:NAD(P)-dependent dehydrogenase (short-subunit alcohol dehydrogenase family)